MTIREIQIQVALDHSRHGNSLSGYLKAREDWRPELPVKVKNENEKSKPILL